MRTFSMHEVMKEAKKRYGQRVTFEATEESPEWLDDSIQFPRLLAEIGYVRLNQNQAMALCDSMNLKIEDLSNLFNRADQEWEKIKRRYIKTSKKSRKENK
jgi:hypothetical protein